jgi:tRNA nucleotidyltransferase (CCA-adding enzyme)
MDQQQRHKFRSRYNVPTAQRKLLDELPGTLPAALMQPTINDFELERALQAFSLVVLRTLQLIVPFVAAERIEHYLTGVRTQPALLSGDDLRAHGVAPGPQYRLILAELRQAQLLQSITTHEAAVRWLTQRENEKQQ